MPPSETSLKELLDAAEKRQELLDSAYASAEEDLRLAEEACEENEAEIARLEALLSRDQSDAST